MFEHVFPRGEGEEEDRGSNRGGISYTGYREGHIEGGSPLKNIPLVLSGGMGGGFHRENVFACDVALKIGFSP